MTYPLGHPCCTAAAILYCFPLPASIDIDYNFFAGMAMTCLAVCQADGMRHHQPFHLLTFQRDTLRSLARSSRRREWTLLSMSVGIALAGAGAAGA